MLFFAVLAGCGRENHSLSKYPDAPVLLFNGAGVSPNDVVAIKAILNKIGVDYATIDSPELNKLDEAELRRHRLLIMPGGNFVQMGKSLVPTTADTIRSAVSHGLNYCGICGGGFLAGKYYEHDGLNLASGVKFGFYSAEDKGIRKAAVPISVPRGPTLEHYWEDGPQFTGWGEVVGKYPDGTPAVVQGTCGNGWVILSGVHPEAPENWRQGMTFNTSTSESQAFAQQLIEAALEGTKLPTFAAEIEAKN